MVTGALLLLDLAVTHFPKKSPGGLMRYVVASGRGSGQVEWLLVGNGVLGNCAKERFGF
jgi:hypothetical protein